MKFVKLIIILLLFGLISNVSKSVENKIELKIDNQIITSFDIKKEKRYLVSLNPNIKKLSDDQLYIMSKNSLVREKIKKIEVLKNFNSIDVNQEIIDQFIQDMIYKVNLSSKKQFLDYIKTKKLSLDYLEEKIKMEIMWNRLIYFRYSDKVKIDTDEIKKQILKNKKTESKQYFLQEILFDVKENENLNLKHKQIKKSIEEEGFEKSALLYSVSDTSKNNGNIGWVDSNVLNKNIYNEIKELNIGDYSNIITIPGGFLILKIIDTKKIEKEIDIEKELKKVVQKKMNEQLNQYSLIYFNKVKKNINIDEL